MPSCADHARVGLCNTARANLGYVADTIQLADRRPSSGGAEMQMIDRIPEVGVFIGLAAIFAFTFWGGSVFGQRSRPRDDTVAEKRADTSGVALGGMLTLTGFLLAFTFSSAGSQFDSRRQLVIDEANAVGATFQGTDLLVEPHRSELRGLLVEYAELRATIDDFEGSSSEFDDFIGRSELLLDQMVVEVNAAANLDPTPVVAGVVGSLNTMIDIHGVRADLRWNRTPPMVFVTLVFLASMGIFLLGYRRELHDSLALVSAGLLVATYVTVFTMMIDLDRHTRGIFSVSQRPMIDLRDSLLSLTT